MSILVSSSEYFRNLVRESLHETKVKASNRTESYLVQLLEHYVVAENLFEPTQDEAGNQRPQTLAEMYLTAGTLDLNARCGLLKKLGDKSLYVSGFFADSLQRKLVDIDYYANMGSAAYRDLSGLTSDELIGKTYEEFSTHFWDFIEVLNHISLKSFIKNDANILRLYDKYLQTGSESLRKQLAERGIIVVPLEQAKKAKQQY